jgi:hypothetical protein
MSLLSYPYREKPRTAQAQKTHDAVVLVARRRWLALFWMGLVSAVGIVTTSVFLGWSRSFSFVQLIVPLSSQQLRSDAAISLPATITHVFWFFAPQHSAMVDLMLHSAVLAGCLIVVAMTIRLTAKYHANDDQDDCLFALWVVTMVLITPTAWPHYMVLFLLPLALLAVACKQTKVPVRALCFGCISYVLTEFGALLSDRNLILGFRFAGVIVAVSALSPIMQYLSSYFLVTDARPEAPPVLYSR